MPQNIVGPHGPGINETTTRPTDTSSGSSVDSWFTPCIGGDPNTGTKIPAGWLNKVTALLRQAIRGMGVADNELDDDMLLKAIQRAARAIANLGTGIGLYKGYNAGTNTNEFYSIKAGSGVTLGLDTVAGELTISAGAGGIGDGDKGDITVSGTGSVWTIDPQAVTTPKLADDAVTNAKLADAAAQTLKGNPTNASANPQDIVPSTLSVGSISANDYVVGHNASGELRRYQTTAFASSPWNGSGQVPIGGIVLGPYFSASAVAAFGTVNASGGAPISVIARNGGSDASITYGTWRNFGTTIDGDSLWQRVA